MVNVRAHSTKRVAIAVSLKQTGKKFGEKQVPMMGITAAFIFAAQMLNFPVAGGTSGHFMGGCNNKDANHRMPAASL